MQPMKDTALVVELWPTEKPVPYARNARVCPESAIAKVAASLKEFGFRQPIVVDEEGVVIVGHTRLLAAQRLGLVEVPVHVATGLTPAFVDAAVLRWQAFSGKVATLDGDGRTFAGVQEERRA